MITDFHPVVQATLGTLMTWGLTAAGAALVFFIEGTQRKFLDASLGFAAGVMTAASYWSLLDPAVEMSKVSGSYGIKGEYAFFPVAVGFLLGAVFVYEADIFISYLGFKDANFTAEAVEMNGKLPYSDSPSESHQKQDDTYSIDFDYQHYDSNAPSVRYRGQDSKQQVNGIGPSTDREDKTHEGWKRILLLIVAITVHNLPEGLAVGVGFGAVGKSVSATFESARNLAIGIGIQNFPEGLAVSLPLKGAGVSTWKSFWYGQLSGMVEPVAGIFGAAAVSVAQPILPYALAFAAGAMIYVVVDDIIPEAQACGNGKLASVSCVVGFLVMMCLDVGLG